MFFKCKVLFIFVFLSGLFFFTSRLAVAATDFFIDASFNLSGNSKISASLIKESQNVYFFVEDNYYNGLSLRQKEDFNIAINNLSSEFDNKIYPKEREVFGQEWSPGIDGDKKITVLLTQISNDRGGYFREVDEYSKSIKPSSNQREMVYINASKYDHPNFASFLAHEFQHLITFNQKTRIWNIKEENWLDEARSEYAPTLIGYNFIYEGSYLKNRIKDFLANPSTSLTKWEGSSVDHGLVFMFMHFLVDRYGERILTSMIQNDKVGIASVEMALIQIGREDNFNDVFTNWTIANYINNILPDNGNQYAYLNPNLFYGYLHVSPQVNYSVFPGQNIASIFNTQNWAGNWIRFSPGSLDGKPRILKIQFNAFGTNLNFIVPYIVNEFTKQSRVSFLNLSSNGGIISVPDFGRLVSSVVLIPSNQFRESNTKIQNSGVSFSLDVSLDENSQQSPGVNIFYDGSLIKAKNNEKVFVINNGYKRWIQSAAIFNHYGNLKWDKIIEVENARIDNISESFLIKKSGDYKIYEVDKLGFKHWLDITAFQFDASNRSWHSVFEVNDYEFNWFKFGKAIKY